MSPGARGFSLLEVMVAVFVLAIGLVAVIRVGAQFGSVSSDLREVTYAGWVAANVIEEVRIAEPWPDTGRRRGQSTMGPRQWYWLLTVQDTEDEDIRRLDVQVFRDAGLDSPVTSLSGFAGNAGAAQ